MKRKPQKKQFIEDNKLYRSCPKCRGTGMVKLYEPTLITKDTKRMLAVMEKYNWNQLDVAKVLGIAQSTVHGWFKQKTNQRGIIKQFYFDVLTMKGFPE